MAIEVSALTGTEDEDDFDYTLTRAEFEDKCRDLFESMIPPLNRAIAEAGCTKDKIDAVILAGGSSRILKVKEDLVAYFGRGEGILKCCDNPDESVSKGACVLAGIM